MRILKYQFNDVARYHKYDKNSPYVYRKIHDLLSEKIPDAAIEHIGSTAIGCGGKGIIDIMIVHEKDMSKRVSDLGFHKDIRMSRKERKVFVGSIRYSNKRYNLHVHLMKPDNHTVKNMVRFRDLLRKDLKKRKEYENIKIRAITNGHAHNTEYNPNKKPFIKRLISKKS